MIWSSELLTAEKIAILSVHKNISVLFELNYKISLTNKVKNRGLSKLFHQIPIDIPIILQLTALYETTSNPSSIAEFYAMLATACHFILKVLVSSSTTSKFIIYGANLLTLSFFNTCSNNNTTGVMQWGEEREREEKERNKKGQGKMQGKGFKATTRHSRLLPTTQPQHYVLHTCSRLLTSINLSLAAFSNFIHIR